MKDTTTKKRKRRWGDQKDARRVRDATGMQVVMAHLWPNRTDCEVYLHDLIDACEEVAYSCVIGVADPRRVQRVKAYIVLRPGVVGDEACKERILEHLSTHVARYALPREIEFRSELPKTLVGKVAYRILEEEANAAEAPVG